MINVSAANPRGVVINIWEIDIGLPVVALYYFQGLIVHFHHNIRPFLKMIVAIHTCSHHFALVHFKGK